MYTKKLTLAVLPSIKKRKFCVGPFLDWSSKGQDGSYVNYDFWMNKVVFVTVVSNCWVRRLVKATVALFSLHSTLWFSANKNMLIQSLRLANESNGILTFPLYFIMSYSCLVIWKAIVAKKKRRQKNLQICPTSLNNSNKIFLVLNR